MGKDNCLRIGILLVGVGLSMSLVAQAPGVNYELLEFNLDGREHRRIAMLSLGSWAALNITGGLMMRSNSTGESRRFYEMNAIWNVVNLGIAGIGYLSLMSEQPAAPELFASLQKHGGFQKILLFNAGLDVGYIMGGLYLRERARRPDSDAERLRGYGSAIILQGAFLFAYDLANYFIAAGRDDDLRMLLGSTGNGLGMVLSF